MKKLSNKPVSGDYSNSLNNFVYENISPKSTCLDVGCWIGNLGEKLIKEKDCVVDGVDFKKEPLKFAQKKGYRNTYQVNLNNDPLDLSKITEKYDYIIFADVLEHLIDPANVLSAIKGNLKRGGHIVISLPNVAFLLNRIKLAIGEWEYKEFGTLDKTHLRFFTISSGENMVKNAGLKVVKTEPYNQFGILRYLKPLDTLLPTVLCYQFLIVAKK